MALFRTLPLLALLSVLVVALSAPTALAQPVAAPSYVYLAASTTSGTFWTGNCSEAYLADHCTSTAPCLIGAEVTVSSPEPSTNCRIKWGDFGSSANGAQRLHLSVVQGEGISTLTNVFTGSIRNAELNFTTYSAIFNSTAVSEQTGLLGSTINVHSPDTTSPSGRHYAYMNLYARDTFFRTYFATGAGQSTMVILSVDSSDIATTQSAEVGNDAIFSLLPAEDGAYTSGNLAAITFSNTRITCQKVNVFRSELTQTIRPQITFAVRSTIGTPENVLYLANPTNTQLTITQNSAIYWSKALVDGPAITFDSRTAIDLFLFSSTLFGRPSGNFSVLQNNACMHITSSQMAINNLEIGCNDYTSPSPRSRCTLDLQESVLTDNRLCVLGAPPATGTISITNRNEIVYRTSGTPSDTIIRDVTLKLNSSVIWNFVSATKGLRLEGRVEFTPSTTFSCNSFYLAPNAHVTLPSTIFTNNVRMAPGTTLDAQDGATWTWQGTVNVAAYTAPSDLATSSIDDPKTPVIDMTRVSTIISPDESVSTTAFQLATSGVDINVRNLTELVSQTSIYWSITNTHGATPVIGDVYRFAQFTSLAAPSVNDTNVALPMINTDPRYFFQGLVKSSDSPSVFDFDFVAVIPPPKSPEAPMPVPQEPIAPPPVYPIPPITPSKCNGSVLNGTQPLPFYCVNGTWTHFGDLTISGKDDLVISAATELVHIIGKLNVTSDNDVRLVGTQSGLLVDRCIHFGAGRIILDYSKGWAKENAWNSTVLVQNGEDLSVICSAPPYLVAPPVSCVDAPYIVIQSGVQNASLAFQFERSYGRCKQMLGVSIGCGVFAIIAAIFTVWMVLYYRRKNKSGYESINGQ